MITFMDCKTYNLVVDGKVVDSKIMEIPCHYPDEGESMEKYLENLSSTEFFAKLKNLKRYCKNEAGENKFSLNGVFGALIQGIILSAREMYKPGNVGNLEKMNKENLLQKFLNGEITPDEYKRQIQNLELAIEKDSTPTTKGKWVVAKED